MLEKVRKRLKDREIAQSIGMTLRGYRERKALLLRQAKYMKVKEDGRDIQ